VVSNEALSRTSLIEGNIMIDKLPTKLHKEPLMDAVFEIRFSTLIPGSSILPGIYFDKLDGEKRIEQLSVASIPKQIRDTDPNLQFAPLMRVYWNDFIILIGDRSVAVACGLPYPGWVKFKETILRVVEILGAVGTIQEIQRYSLKYVDIISGKNIEERIASVNLHVRLGDHCLEKDNFQFRIEILSGQYINAIQIISSAVGMTANKKTSTEGLVIDVDTICNIDSQKLVEFSPDLSEKLDQIHRENKVMFFNCLAPTTLTALEPTYE
jgi:uncharacterized protein (TIGR04255 family)